MQLQQIQRPGNTPLTELGHLGLPNGNRIFAKREDALGSHYFRVYWHLLTQLMEEGKIDPKKHVLLENSSGTAAIAFAIMARQFSFDAAVALPRTTPEKKVQACRDAGAGVLFPEAGKESLYVAGTTELIVKLSRTKRPTDGKEYFHVNHSANRRTLSSMEPIAEEVMRDLPAGTGLDYFIAAIGNGTSLVGPGKPLQAAFPQMEIIGFESFNAPVAYVLKYGEEAFRNAYGQEPEYKLHSLSGTSAYGIDFPFLKENIGMLSNVALVRNGDWKDAQARLLELEGISAGPTSAAAVMVAEQSCRTVQGKNFLTIVYDSAELY
jgi:cysteine synthase A